MLQQDTLKLYILIPEVINYSKTVFSLESEIFWVLFDFSWRFLLESQNLKVLFAYLLIQF